MFEYSVFFIFLLCIFVIIVPTVGTIIFLPYYAWRRDKHAKWERQVKMSREDRAEFLTFIDHTASKRLDEAIQRLPQGDYEKREPLDG